MNPRFTFAVGALALGAAFPVLAEDQASDAVVVTATRFNEPDTNVATNVSVITREDLRSTPAQNLPDVLGQRAGINVSSLGGSMGRNATLDMRGFGATATSNVLVLVDGQRVTPVDSGTIIWSSIPLEDVERVEIVRGSGAVLYGDGATGGVINIVTNKSGKPVAGVTTVLGSLGYSGTDIQLANGNDQAYYRLSASYADAAGYRDNSQQDQKSASGRVGLYLDRGEVFTDFAFYKESSGLPGSVLSAAYRNDVTSTRSPKDTEKRDGYRVRPGVSYQVNDRLTLEGEISFEHQKLDAYYFSPSYGDTASSRVRDTASLTPRIRWRHDLAAFQSETILGLDFYDGKVTSENSGFPNQDASQQSSSFYFQNVTDLTTELSVTFGGRNERMRQTASQDAYPAWFSPVMEGSGTRSQRAHDVGLAYAEKGWRIYGKTGTTFRFANVDELYGNDPFTYAPVFAGDLKPQHGITKELGGSATLGSATLKASIYQLDLTDEIGYDGAVRTNVNFDPTRRKGAELEVDWKISAAWRVKAAYAYVDAKFRNGPYSGNELPLVPHNQASAQLMWDTGGFGGYSAAVRYVGERRYGSDFANAQRMLDGYATLDLQAMWNPKPWRVTVKILNALDRKYAPFAGYSSSRHDTYYYPADERSFLVSARYDF